VRPPPRHAAHTASAGYRSRRGSAARSPGQRPDDLGQKPTSDAIGLLAGRWSTTCAPTRSITMAHAAAGRGTARSIDRTSGCSVRLTAGCNPVAEERPGDCAS
jgi:hypothetical protein